MPQQELHVYIRALAGSYSSSPSSLPLLGTGGGAACTAGGAVGDTTSGSVARAAAAAAVWEPHDTLM